MFGVARTGQAASTVVPSNSTPPTISGELKVGSTLTTSNGTWTGTAPITFTYQWQRCDENGASCAAISGATDNTLRAQAGRRRLDAPLVVAATNADGRVTSTSVPTGVVGTTANTGCPSGTGGDPGRRPRAARAAPDRPAGDLAEPDHHATNQIVAARRITACNGRPVQGALVFVSVVPYDQFEGQELATGADGTVNITLNRQKGFPVSTQAAAARHVRPGAQDRRGPARRHLEPAPRLVPDRQLG